MLYRQRVSPFHRWRRFGLLEERLGTIQGAQQVCYFLEGLGPCSLHGQLRSLLSVKVAVPQQYYRLYYFVERRGRTQLLVEFST